MRDLLVYRSAGGGSYRRTAWFVWPPAEKRPTGSIRIVGITSGGRVEVDGSTLTGLDGSVTKIDWSGSYPGGQVRRVGGHQRCPVVVARVLQRRFAPPIQCNDGFHLRAG